MPDKDKKASAKKPAAGKIFDVSRPGKALADPASKPVIMGHKPEAQQAQTAVSGIGESRPLLKRKIEITPFGENSSSDPAPAEQTVDPMMPAQDQEKGAQNEATADAVAGPPSLPPSENKTSKEISPLNVTVNDAPNAETEAEPKTDAPEPAETPEPAAEAQPESTKEGTTPEPEAPEPEEKPEETPAVAKTDESEESADQTSTEEVPQSSSMPDEAAEQLKAKLEEATPEPKIEPLFDDSGHVVVSMHGHHPHHSAHVIGLVLLIIILALIGLDVLLDLGILNLEGLPHTDLL